MRETAPQTVGAPPTKTPDFVLDLLAELRRSQYHPSGWLRFLGRAWRQSRATAKAHPSLVRSWATSAAVLAAVEASALLAEARWGDRAGAMRAAPWAALLLAATQADAYVHLGMNQADQQSPLHRTLGLPNALTLARQATAGYLWAHLVARRPAARVVALSALALAGLTDIADGAIARRADRQTRLGQYLDSEADFSFWAALAVTAGARGWMPRWLVTLLLARWVGPFAYALATYFGWVSRIPIGSTITGKAAGVAQAAALGLALAPEPVQTHLERARPLVQLALAGLLVAAPLSQWRKITTSR